MDYVNTALVMYLITVSGMYAVTAGVVLYLDHSWSSGGYVD